MNKKIVLTISICLPILYFVGQIIWQMIFMSQMATNSDPIYMVEALFKSMTVLIFLALILFVVTTITLAYLVKHIQGNEVLTSGGKVLWVILIFAFQSIPMLVYLFKYIYDKPWVEHFIRPEGDTGKLTIITGIVTFVPVIFMAIFMVKMMTSMPELMSAAMSGATEATIMAVIMPIILLEVALFFVVFLVFIYYLVLVIKNEALDSGSRTMWIVLLFFFNIITMFVYWISYMLFQKTVTHVTDTEIS